MVQVVVQRNIIQKPAWVFAKERSSLGQLPPCKLPQLVQMALLCHGPRILETVQVFQTCRHSHGTHFDSFDM